MFPAQLYKSIKRLTLEKLISEYIDEVIILNSVINYESSNKKIEELIDKINKSNDKQVISENIIGSQYWAAQEITINQEFILNSISHIKKRLDQIPASFRRRHSQANQQNLTRHRLLLNGRCIEFG